MYSEWNCFREVHMPRWLGAFVQVDSGPVRGDVLLALARGLCRAPMVPVRRVSRFDTFVWYERCDDIPAGCWVYTDGSLLMGNFPLAVRLSGGPSLLWTPVVAWLLLRTECHLRGSTPFTARSCGRFAWLWRMWPSQRSSTRIASLFGAGSGDHAPGPALPGAGSLACGPLCTHSLISCSGCQRTLRVAALVTSCAVTEWLSLRICGRLIRWLITWPRRQLGACACPKRPAPGWPIVIRRCVS